MSIPIHSNKNNTLKGIIKDSTQGSRLRKKTKASSNKSKLSIHLKQLMGELGLNESELARRTGIGQPVVHRLCSGETGAPKVTTLSPIANYFAVSISQLMGDEPLPEDRIPGSFNPNVQAWQRIPLLDWSQVLNWPELPKANKPLSVVSTDLDLGEHAYAVQVSDTTMEPRFQEGTTLLISFGQQPTNRDFAIIYIEGQPLPYFRQVLIDGNHYYLKPLNPDFKTLPLDKPHRFLGVMVQARMDFRKRQTA